MLEKMPNESQLQYHKRLIYGKLVDKSLSDVDYSELSEDVYGQTYSSDVERRMMYGSCKTLQLVDNNTLAGAPADHRDGLDERLVELRKETQKLRDQRTAFNKLIRDTARQEELGEILAESVRKGDLPQLRYEPRPVPLSDNDLLVSLNDIHYGANVANYWNTYNSDVCREMMGRYLDHIISIGQTHGSENCVVWSNGDAISGNIHQSIAVTNKETVIEQVKGVSELIAEFLAELSLHFANVSFVSVAGNHSRIEPNKNKELVSERLDDLIEWYLTARLQNFDNVHIGVGEKIDHTIYLVDVRGKTFCGVHGDFDGSPGKVQSLQAMAGRPVYAVLSGHMHHNQTSDVQGVKTIMAGSFLGMDDFCVKNRIVGRAEQMVCVCDKNGVRCSYDVPLQ